MARLPAGTVTFFFTAIEASTRLLQHVGDATGAQVFAATVVPPTFAKCPGGLGGVLVASATHMGGAVFCVPPTGPVGGPVGIWPGAGGVQFLFASTFTCGPVGVNRYFVTSIHKQNGNLTQFPTTDFTSPPLSLADRLDGVAALVTSRTGAGIGKLTPTSPIPPANLLTFQAPIGDHRGSGCAGGTMERSISDTPTTRAW